MPLPDLIRNNFWWKAGSLLTACVIWYTVRYGDPTMGSDDVTRQFDGIPLRLAVSPGETFTGDFEPKFVGVVLRGSSVLLDRLQRDSVLAVVAQGESEFRRVFVTAPDGIRVVSISPDEVRMAPLRGGTGPGR